MERGINGFLLAGGLWVSTQHVELLDEGANEFRAVFLKEARGAGFPICFTGGIIANQGKKLGQLVPKRLPDLKNTGKITLRKEGL